MMSLNIQIGQISWISALSPPMHCIASTGITVCRVLLWLSSLQDLCLLAVFRFLSQFTLTDNCLVNIYPIGEDYVASTESDSLHKIDKDTLESKEKVN